MATLSQAIGYARTLISKDANTLKDDLSIQFANDALLWIRQRLAEKRKDLFATENTIDIAAANIVGGATPGVFSVPANTFVVLKAISVNFTDPTNQSLFVQARQVDPSNPPGGVSFDFLRKNASTAAPLFDYRGNSYEILPTPTQTLTGAIKLWTYTSPTEYAATTDAIAYPESINWRILSYLIGGFYLSSIGDDNDAAIKMQRAEDLITSILAVVGTGTQQPSRPNGLGLTGYEF